MKILLFISMVIFQFSGSLTFAQKHFGDNSYLNNDSTKTSLSSQNRFYGLLNFGFLTAGSISSNQNSETMNESIFTIGVIGGYRLNEIIRGGLGFEYDKFPNGKVLPIFVDLRFNFLTASKITPISFLNIGYSLAWFENMKGMDGDGAFFCIGGGAEFSLNNKYSINVLISYRKQWSQGFVPNNEIYTDYFGNKYTSDIPKEIKLSYNFLSIMLSFQF